MGNPNSPGWWFDEGAVDELGGWITLPINSFSWLLCGILATSKGLWHCYLVPDVFCQHFCHLVRGEPRGVG